MIQVEPQLLLAFLPRVKQLLTDLCSKDIPEGEDSSAKHLSFLIEFLEMEYASILRKITNLIDNEEITFDLLWAIFLPQSIIFTRCKTTSEPRAVRVQGIHRRTKWWKNEHYWSLACEYIDANEDFAFLTQQFGLAKMELEIQNFEGVVKIAELNAYPIKYHPSAGEVRMKLVRRGHKWVQLNGVHHMHYDGLTYRNSSKVKVSLASDSDFKVRKLTELHFRSVAAS